MRRRRRLHGMATARILGSRQLGDFAWHAMDRCVRRRDSERRVCRTALKFQSSSVTPGAETAGTLLRVALGGWTMLACYFPLGEAKARYFQTCSNVAKAVGASPFLMVGDLNTGNQLADKTLDGARYACADRFDHLSVGDGLVDLWRRTQGSGAREWTWMTKSQWFSPRSRRR